jgi:hypothetical protein
VIPTNSGSTEILNSTCCTERGFTSVQAPHWLDLSCGY